MNAYSFIAARRERYSQLQCTARGVSPKSKVARRAPGEGGHGALQSKKQEGGGQGGRGMTRDRARPGCLFPRGAATRPSTAKRKAARGEKGRGGGACGVSRSEAHGGNPSKQQGVQLAFPRSGSFLLFSFISRKFQARKACSLLRCEEEAGLVQWHQGSLSVQAVFTLWGWKAARTTAQLIKFAVSTLSL